MTEHGPSSPPPTSNPTAQAQAPDGRDQRGRFAKNNKGGPGNPFARQTAQMRKVMLECVSEDDLRQVVAAVLVKAKQGDLGASRLVLSYVVGKPGPAVDPDRLDVEEFALYQAETIGSPEMLRPIQGMSAGLACDLLRSMLPVLDRQHSQHYVHMVRQAEAAEEAALDSAAQASTQVEDRSGPEQPGAGEVLSFARFVGNVEAVASDQAQQPQPRTEAAAEAVAGSASPSEKPAPGQSRPAVSEQDEAQALPSVEQIVGMARHIVAAVDGGPAVQASQGHAGTVNKPAQTVERAANPSP